MNRSLSFLKTPVFRTLSLLVGFVLAAGLTYTYPAYAQHDAGLFELDGNAADDSLVDGDDWNPLYLTPPSGYSFVDDNNNGPDGIEDVSVYTQGSKDINYLAEGGCTAKTQVNPNVDYEHGYAMVYDYLGDPYIVFGANRSAENGDKALGVWFMQNDVDCDPYDPDFPGIWQGGDRTENDVFAVVHFTRGGSVGAIEAYQWVPGETNNLVKFYETNEGDCQLLDPDDDIGACITTNGARGENPLLNTIFTTWDGLQEPGSFMEGFVNLGTIFDGLEQVPCFSTVLLEGRSSTSVKSNLHEYIRVPIETCGNVVLEKETDPLGDTQTFAFTFGPDGEQGTEPDGSPIADGGRIFIDDVHPGSYDAYETVPDGWTLDAVDCLDDAYLDEENNTYLGTTGGDSTAGDNINVSRTETVHCLFKNVKKGNLIIRKVYTGEVANTTTFSYEVLKVAPAETISTFDLEATVKESDHYDCDTGVQCKTIEDLVPTVYTVEETEVGDASFEALSCTSDNGESTVLYDGAKATIGLTPGDTVTCTYENFIAAAPGDIYLQKETIAFDDDDQAYRVAANATFSYDTTSQASGEGGDDPGQIGLPNPVNLLTSSGFVSEQYSPVYAGTHTVDEQTPPDGYEFHDLDCGLATEADPPAPGEDDVGTSVSGDAATITINDGEAVVCLWRNKVIPAKAKVVKTTVPAGNESGWEFKLYKGETLLATGSTDSEGNLDFGVDLNAGDYKVVETAKAGFDLTDVGGADNAGGDDVCTFTVAFPDDRDSTFECTFENTERGQITLIKETVGGTGSFDFAHKIDGVSGAIDGLATSLDTSGDNPASDDSNKLVPGAYSISETVPAGWDLTSLTCVDTDTEGTDSTGNVTDPLGEGETGTASIYLDPGETVTCTFVNSRLPTLTLVKEVNNQFGGEREASEWTLSATATGGATAAFDFSGKGEQAATGNSADLGPYDVAANVAYLLEEDQFDFYEVQTDWSCAGDGTFDGEANTISLGYGDDATCTIVNKDILVEFCPDGSNTGRPLALTLEYTGENNDINSQEEGNVVIGPLNGAYPDPADIVILTKQGTQVPEDSPADNVAIGDTFSYNHWKDNGGAGIPPVTIFEIYTSDYTEGGGTFIQSIEFHTSCSQPLNVGDEYGPLKVVGGTLNDGTPVGQQ
ncbi:prealbumin-like fold domain-containing protein [Marinobacterium sp. YM272]|uniref:prealbumin-like fold domain-containing protein n=1 Tax=Marinobacterium sp. YM272 TaxID=3421654 RepID=UPI003D7FEDA3